ncbi:hypothetical protein [Sphingomonas sp.]|uniref:hypothetical protein n=1 Tax=Sphingomonas sp. TaxID=28214 RepID=UPI0035C79DF4
MASKDDREQALAAALRDNLRRRKAQARAAEDESSRAAEDEAPPVNEPARTTPR